MSIIENKSINQQAALLFLEQKQSWSLAQNNFEGLKTVQTKRFYFDDFEVLVQFNPARIVSSGAKVDAKTIAERKCFLCTENRPPEQKGVDLGSYILLVNPFPIFPEHFTIPHKDHIDQQIKDYFTDLLEIAALLSEYLVFYNGPKCGASAPDHLHFQAGTKDFLPLVNDYKRLKSTFGKLIDQGVDYEVYTLNNYLRTVWCIESSSTASAELAFGKLFASLQKNADTEPMMNIVCSFENGKWFTFILPRANFRPWQYTADDEQQLMISPATVEMSGVFITPIEKHFQKICKEDIISIFEQSSIKNHL